ncbi:MAG: hypothetical protein ACLU8D_01815 [Enterocloster sp.]
MLNWPVNMTYLAAQWLVERDSAGKELDDEELLRNTDRRSLYGWYLDQTYGGAYVSGARFSALGPEQGLGVGLTRRPGGRRPGPLYAGAGDDHRKGRERLEERSL